MPNHANRCLQVTCNFTHPSVQTGHRNYPSEKYIYAFPNDDLSMTIQNHAKRKYASEHQIRGGWIGHITVTTSIRNNMRADSNISEAHNFPT